MLINEMTWTLLVIFTTKNILNIIRVISGNIDVWYLVCMLQHIHACISVVSAKEAHASINQFYIDVVKCLSDAFVLPIPQIRRNFYKFWWDEELNLLKQQAMQSFNIRKSVSKPRSGKEFDDMHFAQEGWIHTGRVGSLAAHAPWTHHVVTKSRTGCN